MRNCRWPLLPRLLFLAGLLLASCSQSSGNPSPELIVRPEGGLDLRPALTNLRSLLRVDDRWIEFVSFEPAAGNGYASRAEGLLWRITVEGGTGRLEARLENLGAADVAVEGWLLEADLADPPALPARLLNGYQSWSVSPVIEVPEDNRSIEEIALRPTGQNTDMVTLDPAVSWWMDTLVPMCAAPAERWKSRSIAVRRAGRIEWGFAQGLTGDSVALRPGDSLAFDPMEIGDGCLDPTDRRPGTPEPPFMPIAWSSWNTLFDAVTEEDILANARYLREQLPELPVNTIQIDDGWERDWGDWEANAKFLDGMDGTARKIRDLGFTPGIWFAPFLVDETSPVAAAHPDWLLNDTLGDPIRYGVANMGGGYTKRILDLSHPAARAWLDGQIRKIVDWGYRYLKIDFLFGAAIEGRFHTPGLTAIQVYREALRLILNAAGPDVYVMACGAPLWPSIGLAHAVRTGGDIVFFNLPSEWAMIKPQVINLATRSFIAGRIAPDPDSALVRDVPLEEARFLLAAVLMAPGTFTLGDDLRHLPPDRIDLYRRAAEILTLLSVPPASVSPLLQIPALFENPSSVVPRTLFDIHLSPARFDVPPVWVRSEARTTLVAVFNGRDEAQVVTIPASAQPRGSARVTDVWSSQSLRDGLPDSVELPPHDARLFLIRTP